MNGHVATVVTALASARRAMQLYPAAHPVHEDAVRALVSGVASATAREPLVINWYQGRLYHGSMVLPDSVSGTRAIAEAFESHGIESLTFVSSFADADAVGLTETLSIKPSRDFDVNAELAARSVTAVKASVLTDENREERAERDRQRAADRALYQRAIASLRHTQERFASGDVGDLTETTELVNTIMERLLADPSAMLALTTIRNVGGEHSLFHSLNVTIYSLLLGQRLGLPDDGLASLGMAALMHDVGKAAFDVGDPSQVEPMLRMHPEVGAEMLQRVGLGDTAPMLVAYEHHMGADGSGWPEVPDGYVAHPFSRIVAVTNRYHNLTDPEEEPSRALTPDRAVVQVLREARSSLDPFFARLFANALGVFPVGCVVRLSDQTVAVVSRPGNDPLAPTVRLSYDALGTELDTPTELDLETGDVRIIEVIDPATLDVDVAEKL